MLLWSRLHFLFFLFFLPTAAGCGYHFSSTSPIVLPANQRRIYLQRVNDPTTEVWLEPALRTEIRDEFTRRGNVLWVDEDSAQSFMRVTIKRYSSGSSFKGRDDTTIRRTIDLVISADIVDAASGHVLWSSGDVLVQESFLGRDEQAAGHRAADLAAERLADRLQRTF